MSQGHIRYLSQDHILFKEAIVAFSKFQAEKNPTLVNLKLHETTKDKRIYGYLVFDFNLSEDIVCGDLTIFKSEKVYFDLKDRFGQQKSWTYISAVRLPEYVNFYNSHLYTIALSSICSFAFERPVYSATGNMYEARLDKLASQEELMHIGLSFPVLSLGMDGTESSVHPSIVSQWIDNFKEIFQIVTEFSETDISNSKLSYRTFFQIIRLVQLSLQNKKNDFDLSFTLLVSAIESAATFYSPAISPQKSTEHRLWLKLKKSEDSTIRSLAKKYEELWAKFSQVDKDSQLSQRFIKFIFECAPKESWEATIDNDLLSDGFDYRQKNPDLVSTSFPELTPESFTNEELKDIISKTYGFRSKFIHKGESMPHKEHKNTNRDRFFEEKFNSSRFNVYREKSNFNGISYHDHRKSYYDFYAKYELMSCIARVSITEYAKQVIMKIKH